MVIIMNYYNKCLNFHLQEHAALYISMYLYITMYGPLAALANPIAYCLQSITNITTHRNFHQISFAGKFILRI